MSGFIIDSFVYRVINVGDGLYEVLIKWSFGWVYVYIRYNIKEKVKSV